MINYSSNKSALNILIILNLLMSGCSSPESKVDHANLSDKRLSSNSAETTPSLVTNIRQQPSHLTQCNRDLESLRTVNTEEYRRYQVEYDNLMKSSANFLSVKDDVSPEVAALARPRFQFALVNLCYRIKDTLAKTLINQAGGGR